MVVSSSFVARNTVKLYFANVSLHIYTYLTCRLHYNSIRYVVLGGEL